MRASAKACSRSTRREAPEKSHRAAESEHLRNACPSFGHRPYLRPVPEGLASAPPGGYGRSVVSYKLARSERGRIDREVGPLGIRGNWDRRRVEAVSRLGEMDRRNFVKLAGASAAALVFGAGPFTQKAWAQTTFSS